MSLETAIVASLKALETNDLDLAHGRAPIELEVRHAFTSGSGANQASKAFSDSRTIAASGSEDLDLAGALASAFGAVLAFAAVKAILTHDGLLTGIPFAVAMMYAADGYGYFPGDNLYPIPVWFSGNQMFWTINTGTPTQIIQFGVR